MYVGVSDWNNYGPHELVPVSPPSDCATWNLGPGGCCWGGPWGRGALWMQLQSWVQICSNYRLMEWWWMMVDDARLASAQWNRCCIAMSRPTLAFFNDSWGYLHKWLRFPKTGVKFETQLEDLSTWDLPETGNTENHQPLNPASDILQRTCLSLSQFLFCLLGRFPESYLDMINFWKVWSVLYLAPSWLSLVYFAKICQYLFRRKFPRNGKSWKIHPHRRCRSLVV